MKINAPCMGCTERLPEGVCHASCNRYKDFIEKRKGISEVKKQSDFENQTFWMNEYRRRKSRARKEAKFKSEI